MKTLLCATDFSQNSIAALKLANYLSKKFGARLYVLHVYNISVTFVSTVSLAYAKIEETTRREGNARLLEFTMDHLGRDAQSDRISMLVKENSTASEGITDYADKIEPDLILAGTRGSTAVKDLFLGSTVSALIEKAKFPVLSIPPEFQWDEVKTILYATAFEEADIVAIHRISEFARLLKAKIHIVHVSTEDEYAGEDQFQWFREMLDEKVDYPHLSFELQYSDDISEGIHSCLYEQKPQILAMLEREGHSLISNLWHRDLVKKMKLEIEIPLMSFHKKYLAESDA